MAVSKEENQNALEFVAKLLRVVVTHVQINVPNAVMGNTFVRKRADDFYFAVMFVDVLVIWERTVHRVKRNVLSDASTPLVLKNAMVW